MLEVTLEENESIIIIISVYISLKKRCTHADSLSLLFLFPQEQLEAGERRAATERRRLGGLGVLRGLCVRVNRRRRPPAVRGLSCDCVLAHFYATYKRVDCRGANTLRSVVI